MNFLFCPHPDDEVFLLGFMLLYETVNFQVVVVSDGRYGVSKNEPGVQGERLIARRESETREFCQKLELPAPKFLGLIDGHFSVEEAVAGIKDFLQFQYQAKIGFNVEKVFTFHPNELHIDHKTTAEAVKRVFESAFGLFSDPVLDSRQLEIEEPAETVVLTDQEWTLKKECVQIYKSQRHFLPERLNRVERVWKF